MARLLKVGNPRCHFAGKHHHRDENGDRWHLCDVHLRTIERRERLRSADELTRRWREG